MPEAARHAAEGSAAAGGRCALRRPSRLSADEFRVRASTQRSRTLFWRAEASGWAPSLQRITSSTNRTSEPSSACRTTCLPSRLCRSAILSTNPGRSHAARWRMSRFPIGGEAPGRNVAPTTVPYPARNRRSARCAPRPVRQRRSSTSATAGYAHRPCGARHECPAPRPRPAIPRGRTPAADAA